MNTLRALALAVTLTRSNGTGEFTTTYDTENCTSNTLDVDIETNGATISIAVESGYTFKIDGTEYEEKSVEDILKEAKML